MPFYHLVFRMYRISFTQLLLFLHLSLFHLGFITNPWYNSFGRRCFSYRAPDVLCNWQVMFFDFTHQELFFLLIGKPLRNPATMAGVSGYNKNRHEGGFLLFSLYVVKNQRQFAAGGGYRRLPFVHRAVRLLLSAEPLRFCGRSFKFLLIL